MRAGNKVATPASRRSKSPAPEPKKRTVQEWRQLLHLLCSAVAVRATGDRAWTFVLPLFLSEAYPGSLAPVSLLSLAVTVGVIALSPPLAQWLASHQKPSQALMLLVILENSAVVLGGCAVVAASGGQGGHTELFQSPLFVLGLLLLAVDAAVTSVLTLLMEKDAIARLFASEYLTRGSVSLAEANAVVTRADLGASVGTYLLLGWLAPGPGAGGGGAARLIAYLAAWHVVAGTIVLVLLRRLRAAAPELHALRHREAPAAAPGFVRLLLDGPRTLARLERRPRLLLAAFVCLFFTVLSPGGLLTACLRSRGTGPQALAYFRAAAQVAGAAGTAVAPRLIARRGPLRAGVLLQRLQLVFVALATAACVCPLRLWPAAGMLRREHVVMVGVVASRVGLWGFDLCERQALQQACVAAGGSEGGARASDGTVALFATEKALTELAGLAMLAASLPLSDPEAFGALAALSLAAVTGAAALIACADSGKFQRTILPA